jgi:hypothetical protein
MRVSLCVLSGSRRGEWVELDTDEFRAGGEPSCDVCFLPEDDPAARGVCVRLYREDDGWRISPASGRESLVNQQILDSTLPIRSGDIVRVASRAKVEGIKPGAALQCWTTETPPIVAFADEAVFDREFRLKVRKQPVQLSQMTFLSDDDDEEDHSPDDRRLFELDGPAEDFLEGSPLLNSEGELVALYSKTPVAADNEQRRKSPATAGKQQPRAALVDAEMIAALWTGKPSVMWVGYRENRSPAAAAGGGK